MQTRAEAGEAPPPDPAAGGTIESTTRHTHDAFQVGWARGGAGQVYCRGEVHAAGAGSLVVVPPGEVHYGHSVGASGWEYALLNLDPALLREAGAERADRCGAPLPDFDWVVSTEAPLVEAFERWARGSLRADSALEGEVLLLDAVGALLARSANGRRPMAAGRERRAVGEAVAYLEAHYAETVSLDRLAGVAGLSKFYLVRAFKREMGLPPHAYQTQVRIARAMRLLRRGWSISRTAFATGFAAQSHLNRHFKRILGVTPGRYAELVRARTH